MEEEFEIPKTPEPKEWVCLGSDLEVLEMHVHTHRPLVSAGGGREGEREREREREGWREGEREGWRDGGMEGGGRKGGRE